MPKITPIQTKYRGYRFRSRLEARWAVFFDVAHIKWEYEPQGFSIRGSGGYLPDFYLPDLDCYFEVKGTNKYNKDKMQQFALLIKKPLVIAEGPIPDPNDFDCDRSIGLQFLHPSLPSDWPDGIIDDFAYGYKDMFLRCDGCGKIAIMNEVYCTMKDNCSCGDKSVRWMPLSDALEAARSARFEDEKSQVR
ncbi:MAG: hypothetical protein ABTQ34_05390 [Bdellovibrionales bacterium]